MTDKQPINYITSCNLRIESRVFLVEFITSEYASVTPSSELQKADLIGSCIQFSWLIT